MDRTAAGAEATPSLEPGAKAPLRRWPKTDDGLSRYRHPHRYVISRKKRDWNLGGITRGAQHQWSPMYWWEVKPLFGPRSRRVTHDFDTLREAREWCDAHPPPDLMPAGTEAAEQPHNPDPTPV